MPDDKKPVENASAKSVNPTYEHLDSMYPDLYYRVYPVVKQTCEIYDVPSNPGFHPYPSRAAVERTADYIYQRVAVDLGYGANLGYMDTGYMDTGFNMERQEGRRLLRALVTILLIRELLRRRGSY